MPVFDRDLSHVHPKLAPFVPLIMERYAARHPGHRLMVAETRRTVEEQAKRFADGSTRCDGTRSFSMHNYPISYALDFWVERQQPDQRWKITWDMACYVWLVEIVYELIEAEHPLESGLDWDRDGVPGTIDRDEAAMLRDGPHVQLVKGVLHRDLQAALNAKGANPQLVVDGDWGRKSQAEAKRATGLDGRASPQLWALLAPYMRLAA